jgi:hypothetical protein
MPRFYFHIRDGATLISDEEGMELADVAAAADEARASARDLIAAALKTHRGIDGQAVDVTDELGRILITLNVRDVWRAH